jgi:hypothetical protein
MTDSRKYLHPAAFIALHLVAVLSALYIGYKAESIACLFLTPLPALLAPVVLMLQVEVRERRKVYLISMAIAGLVVMPILAWWGFIYFISYGKIG